MDYACKHPVAAEGFKFAAMKTGQMVLDVVSVGGAGELVNGALEVGEGAVGAEEAVEMHHAWPEYLGGPKDQDLVPLPESLHDSYHAGLKKLASRSGLADSTAMPCTHRRCRRSHSRYLWSTPRRSTQRGVQTCGSTLLMWRARRHLKVEERSTMKPRLKSEIPIEELMRYRIWEFVREGLDYDKSCVVPTTDLPVTTLDGRVAVTRLTLANSTVVTGALESVGPSGRVLYSGVRFRIGSQGRQVVLPCQVP